MLPLTLLIRIQLLVIGSVILCIALLTVILSRIHARTVQIALRLLILVPLLSLAALALGQVSLELEPPPSAATTTTVAAKQETKRIAIVQTGTNPSTNRIHRALARACACYLPSVSGLVNQLNIQSTIENVIVPNVQAGWTIGILHIVLPRTLTLRCC